MQVGKPDRASRDLAASHGQHDGCSGGRVIADLALQLFVGVAVARRGHGNRDGGEDFGGVTGALLFFSAALRDEISAPIC